MSAIDRGALERFIATALPRWIEMFRGLVRERSVFEHEQAIVDLVAGWAADCGVQAIRVPHDAGVLAALAGAQEPISAVSGRASLAARVRGLESGRSIAFNTHLDVVPEGDPAGWTHPPFDPFLDERQRALYGRGAMDDKAGVAISLAVLETLQRLPIRLAGDVVFHWVLEDETTGNGSLLCLHNGHRADAAVIIDGTRPDRAIWTHAGQLQFEVTARGAPASVSVSHVGVNAVEVLSELLLALRQWVRGLNDSRPEPWTMFPSPFQFVTEALHGEGTTLTVPERARARCYLTFLPPFTLADMREQLRRIADEFAAERGLAGRFSFAWSGFSASPVTPDESSVRPLAESLARAAARAGVGPVALVPSTGTSDLRHFAAARIPCLLYGPGRGFNPHRPDEHFFVDDLSTMTTLFCELCLEWCGLASPSGREAR